MRIIIFSIVIILCLFAALSSAKRGEILQVKAGVIEKCDTLSGGQGQSMTHATIKDEDGNYVIASLQPCIPDANVSLFIKRGALYFNTVFAAKPN